MALARTVRRHRSTVERHDLADDTQAETQSSMTTRRRGVGLTESVEHERQHVRANPDAGVGHANLDSPVDAVQADGNQVVRS